MWRGGFNLSPGTNRQKGCITLWDASWSVLDKIWDNSGRFCATTLKKGPCIITIMNVYAPNDHDVNFFINIFEKLISLKEKYESTIFLTGDFNLVIDVRKDSLNRACTKQELIAVEFVTNSAKALQLFDCYRHKVNKGGYTWNRGNCYSRLDMVFASDTLEQSIKNVSIDWTFDQSDHAMLEIEFQMPNHRAKGPGLPRVNASLLDKENLVTELEKRMKKLITDIGSDWNPHMKWEFLKVGIRSTMWEIGGREKRIENGEIKALTEQIKALKDGKALMVDRRELTYDMEVKLETDICDLEKQLKVHFTEKSKYLAQKAKTKWFDEGEKSNKYFLNLIKKRSAESEITSLENGNKVANGQRELEELVKEFYEQLYSKDDGLNDNCDLYFPDCRELNRNEREAIDTVITLEELEKTVKSCSDSSPGPDGIPYSVYKKLWGVVGPYLLESWLYSREKGILSTSQRHSSITLLPKEGKDLSKIGNWRPITLTNCDLKIFTKLYSNRLSKVLDQIIHPSQTAYIPNRVVHDNLRMFEFYREYCNKHNVDAVLMSLDARKAFDSVDHNYMGKCLKHYGFSESFISIVRRLYKDIKADILVNGYKTASIKICRSVKQGDALSCALFILCIDPLIRRIEINDRIEPVRVRTPLSNYNVSSKCGAFADDVGAVVKNNKESIEGVLREYELFASYSGIKINEDKTEILTLHSDAPITYTIQYNNSLVNITTIKEIKICGIWLCNDKTKEYNSILRRII